ncbi:hypothetical protein [uncultured Thiocystis sp.]|jgi:hypothetical protein|uniref:hypothetical protein n=1 Tax=uncultured Thiocystis sp. TaxID=1202134 RepID=UPI0025DC5FB1|nr:hypothetical protein [uncultured Thiocystis sp.]
MTTKKLIGLIGSIFLCIGVFAPIASVPIMGDVNYFQNGRGDGSIVLVLALISLVLVLAEKYKGLWFTGIVSLGIMLFTFINFHSKISQVKADMESELASNPFRGLADAAIQSVQLEWGFALLIVGAVLVIASAAMRVEREREAALAQGNKAESEYRRRANHCMRILQSKGYQFIATKSGSGWIVNKPSGGFEAIESLEKLEKYAKSRI